MKHVFLTYQYSLGRMNAYETEGVSVTQPPLMTLFERDVEGYKDAPGRFSRQVYARKKLALLLDQKEYIPLQSVHFKLDYPLEVNGLRRTTTCYSEPSNRELPPSHSTYIDYSNEERNWYAIASYDAQRNNFQLLYTTPAGFEVLYFKKEEEIHSSLFSVIQKTRLNRMLT